MSVTTKIDDSLSIQNGHLFIEKVDTVELIERFGSPLFVLSEEQIRRNTRAFQRSFQDGWSVGDVKVMPAAKANWISAVQRILVEEGCGCDVYSPGELAVALRVGFDPETISVNGVPKDRDHIYQCVKNGVRITIDSVEEIDLIEQAANEQGRVVKVRLRLKPAIRGFIDRSDFVPEGLAPTDIAALVYKGGLAFEDVVAIGQRILQSENIQLVGFHEHHGRHHRSTRYWEEQMKAFACELGKVSQALGGFQPEEIDIGGGFAIPRDPFNAATHYSEPLQLAALYSASKGANLFGSKTRYRLMRNLINAFILNKPNQIPAPSIESYAQACTSTLLHELPKNGIDTRGLTLQIEPGRSLHGNAGIHLATVTNIKRMKDPIIWNLIVVDTTEFWFTGGRYEHHLHDYIFANKADAPMVDKADIIGRSCYGDRLMPTVPIPEVEVGDILGLFDAGAYQEVSMSNFNAIPRPATVLVTGNQVSIIRRRETQEEVFSRDIIPDHLSHPSINGHKDSRNMVPVIDKLTSITCEDV